eukprot:132168_1
MDSKSTPNKAKHASKQSSSGHGRHRPLPGQRRGPPRSGGRGGSGQRRGPPRSSKSGKGRSGHSKKITMLNKPPEQLGNYKITKEIGKGAFGRVYKCIDKRNLRVFAIKTITTRNMNAQQKKDVQSEVELLASLPSHE